MARSAASEAGGFDGWAPASLAGASGCDARNGGVDERLARVAKAVVVLTQPSALSQPADRLLDDPPCGSTPQKLALVRVVWSIADRLPSIDGTVYAK